MILKEIMRRLFIRYIHGSHIILLRSTSSNTQVIRNYAPQSQGTAGTLISWLWVPGMTLYYQRICPAGAWLQMAGALFFLLLSTSHLWPRTSPEECRGQWLCVHDSSPPQSDIILHCHVCLGLSNPYISSTTHLPGHGYPRPAQGLGWSSGYKWLVHYL